MPETRDSVSDIWGARTPYVGDWPVRVDECLTEQADHWVPSTCALCSNGCGMDIGVKDGRIVGVRGRADDIASRGRLGPKGLHGWEANNSPDRLTHPLIRRAGHLEPANWVEAMDLLVGMFNTGADYCETYGHDLVTGTSVTAEQYVDPQGKAFLRPADYQPPLEAPDEEYPLWLTTGQVVYQWHTRTKTARATALHEAAPDAYVRIAAEDAQRHGIVDDMVEITSRRGTVLEPARVGDITPGVVFIPFHYGYWDQPDRARAANELTLTGWDPVSKQPFFKYAAVRIRTACRLLHAGRRQASRGTGGDRDLSGACVLVARACTAVPALPRAVWQRGAV